MYVYNLKLIRGCVILTSLFSSFVEFERNLLINGMKPHINEDGSNIQPQVNNTLCSDRYSKRCSMECPLFVSGIVAGHKVSWWTKHKTI